MEEDAIPVVSTPPSWTAGDVLGVVSVFERMLASMEHRLIDKFEDGSRNANERWVQHERDRVGLDSRFEKLETRLHDIETTLTEHLVHEREEDLIIQARVRPVKNGFAWLWLHWRDVALLGLAIAALATLIAERLSRTFP